MRIVSRKDFLKSLGLAGVTVVATPFIYYAFTTLKIMLMSTISGSVSDGCKLQHLIKVNA